jgi:hypothetical protein
LAKTIKHALVSVIYVIFLIVTVDVEKDGSFTMSFILEKKELETHDCRRLQKKI